MTRKIDMKLNRRTLLAGGVTFGIIGTIYDHIADEQMEASWDYTKKLAIRSEEIGYDLTLIAELLLNDIKGINAPSLDAWSTAAASSDPSRQ